MAKDYSEEIVYARSEDGLILEGAVFSPASVVAKSVVVVWVHGIWDTFYKPLLVRIGRAMASRGYTTITGNNRGHDLAAVIKRPDGENVLAGCWWEKLDESPLDVAAWVDFAASLGFQRVALAGHSLGALKAPVYQAQRQDPRIVALITASPPVMAGRFAKNPLLTAEAEKMVAEGRGQDLMEWGMAPQAAGTMSAQSLLNWAQTDLDIFGLDSAEPMIAQIRCPLLAFFGTNEPGVGTAADLEIIRKNARAAARIDTRMFEGCDHNYTGHEAEVGAAVAEWLDSLG